METIEKLTLDKINKLSEQHIAELKSKPRTGKEVRIDKYNLGLPVQSLYDHIISFSHNADTFLEWFELTLDDEERNKLASYISYHDLAELITGDVPDFTPEDFRKHSKQGHVGKEEKMKAEKKANLQLIESLPKHLETDFREMLELEKGINNENNLLAKFASVCDRSEPIIAVWRYIEMFREGINIDDFVDAMSDFFENPRPLECSYNEKTTLLIKTLQNKENAKKFHKKGAKYLESIDGLPSNLLNKIIVLPKMHFVSE